MPSPRAPSKVEPLTFPVFGMSWFGDPADGRSIRAFTGGGGSARTGIHNFIVVQDGYEEHKISTGDAVGVALLVYKNPVSHRLWLVVALGGEVHRYSLPDRKQQGVLSILDCTENEEEEVEQGSEDETKKKTKDLCNAVTVNAMADRIAVGCDSGLIKVFETSDEQFASEQPLYVCEGHTKAICAMQFSLRNGLLLSSAKDGTARVWNETAECLSGMTCDCNDPDGPPQRGRGGGGQILVRGCAFLDMNGQHAVTVASTRRGRAFLSQWARQENNSNYACAVRTACSPCPISAMSLSQDGELLALGSVDGSIILWSVPDWKPLKTFPEVHDLPVTCIAVRPFPVPLQGEEESGVAIHARSASADSKMGLLTMQRRAPKRKDDQTRGGGVCYVMAMMIHRLLQLAVIMFILYPLIVDTMTKCDIQLQTRDFQGLKQCFLDDVLIAPSWRAGVSTPPF